MTYIQPLQKLASPPLVPAADVYDDGKDIIVELAVPGWRSENISILVENDTLIVTGRREMSTAIDEKSYWQREIRIGEFSRSITLPTSVEEKAIGHTLTDGLLTITLPKRSLLPPPHPTTV